MDTTTHSTLTTTERSAALAWIERGASSLRQLAAQLDLAADELLDILTRPNVTAFIEAADALIQTRADILTRYNHTDALQALVQLAQNPEADHAVRLRAAITILQGPPLHRAAPSPAGSPTVPRGPKPSQPTSNHSSSAAAGPPMRDQPSSSKPISAPSTTAGSANGARRLNRAAGAAFARHDRVAAGCEIESRFTRSAASPATSGRPP